MTAKQLYKWTLIELSKVNAPALKLYEFNYYFNKAVNQYVNLIYNVYDTNQQTTDDIRVLQSSVYMTPQLVAHANRPLLSSNEQAPNYLSSKYSNIQSLYGAAYECWLPMDYLHILNCVCTFEVTQPYDCYDAGTFIQKPATRLTSDTWALVMDDIYNRPSPERPYYQIYNQNRDIGPSDEEESTTTDLVNSLPIDPVKLKAEEDQKPGESLTIGTDMNGEYRVTEYDSDKIATGAAGEDVEDKSGGNNARTFTFNNGYKMSLVEKTAAQRISNPSNVRLEIRYGRDNSLFVLREVQIDYLKSPQFIRLTQEQIDLTQDVSQMLEWPDYICQEIANILVHLIMERTSDPRFNSNMQINQTIARSQTQASQQQADTSA